MSEKDTHLRIDSNVPPDKSGKNQNVPTTKPQSKENVELAKFTTFRDIGDVFDEVIKNAEPNFKLEKSMNSHPTLSNLQYSTGCIPSKQFNIIQSPNTYFGSPYKISEDLYTTAPKESPRFQFPDVSVVTAAGPPPTQDDDEEHVRRPMNAFMVWSRTERRRLAMKYPSMLNCEISKMLGAEWSKMSDDEKEPYIQESKKLRSLHNQRYPDYSYRPRRRRRKHELHPPNLAQPLSAPMRSPNFSTFPRSYLGGTSMDPNVLSSNSAPAVSPGEFGTMPSNLPYHMSSFNNPMQSAYMRSMPKIHMQHSGSLSTDIPTPLNLPVSYLEQSSSARNIMTGGVPSSPSQIGSQGSGDSQISPYYHSMYPSSGMIQQPGRPSISGVEELCLSGEYLASSQQQAGTPNTVPQNPQSFDFTSQNLTSNPQYFQKLATTVNQNVMDDPNRASNTTFDYADFVNLLLLPNQYNIGGSEGNNEFSIPMSSTFSGQAVPSQSTDPGNMMLDAPSSSTGESHHQTSTTSSGNVSHSFNLQMTPQSQ